jgi:vacuolar-type H+-ATPase subunit I/STV1
MFSWVRFTLNHPWLSAAIVAGVAGLFLGLLIRPAFGAFIGVVGFIVVGMGQRSQTKRATAEEQASGQVEPRRGPVGRWMVSHPWLSGGVAGLLLAVGTMIRVYSDGASFSRALMLSLALGAVVFLVGGLLMSAVKRRNTSPR